MSSLDGYTIETPPLPSWKTWGMIGIAIVLMAGASIAMTYPLITDLRHSVLEKGDSLQVAWLLGWSSQVLFRSPTVLFNAPVMYPERLVLAYIEHMNGLVFPFSLIYLTSQNAVLSFNITLIFGYFMSGFGLFLLLYFLSNRKYESWFGALLGGLFFIVNPWRFWQFVHLEQVSAIWISLGVLFLILYLKKGNFLYFLAFFLFVTLQSLISYYFVLQCALVYMFSIIWFMLVDKITPRRFATLVLLTGLGLFLVHYPFARLYMANQTHRAMLPEEQHHFSIQTRQDFFADPSHFWVREFLFEEPIPSPNLERYVNAGLGVYFLSAIAIASFFLYPKKKYRITILLCIILSILGTILALGPFLALGNIRIPLPFGFLRIVPGIGSLRAPARLWQISLLAMCILSYMGIIFILRFSRIGGTIVCCLLFLSSLYLSIYRPVRMLHDPPDAPVYSWINDVLSPDAVLLHVPVDFDTRGFVDVGEAPKLFAALLHQRRLVNSFMAVTPPQQRDRYRVLATFPSSEALCCLREIGVTHILVDSSAYGQPFSAVAVDEWGLEQIYADETHQVLTVTQLNQPQRTALSFGAGWNGLEVHEGQRWNLAKGDAVMRLHGEETSSAAISFTLRVVTAPDVVSIYVDNALVREISFDSNGEFFVDDIMVHFDRPTVEITLSNIHNAIRIGDDPRWISFGIGEPMINDESASLSCLDDNISSTREDR